MQRAALLFGLCAVFIWGCEQKDVVKDENALARVYDSFLYPSDLAKVVPDYLDEADSITLAKSYIDQWVKRQLKLKRASTLLEDDQDDIIAAVADFETSLLVHKLEERIIANSVDTFATMGELQEYYDENSKLFPLRQDAIQANYVELPTSVKDAYRLRTLIRSEDEGDKKVLKNYCEQYASSFSFSGDWYFLGDFKQKARLKSYADLNYLKYNKFIESRDTTFRYFIEILDTKAEGEIAPLFLVQDKVRKIVLNNKKLSAIRDLEKELYEKAKSNGNIELYTK